MNMFDPMYTLEDFEEEPRELQADGDLEIEDALNREAWVDEEALSFASNEQLIWMLKEAKTELKRQVEVLDQVRNKLKVGRSIEGYFWIVEYDPNNPPQEDTLARLSEKYLGGEPVVGLPRGTSLNSLNDQSLGRIGLRRSSMNEVSKSLYENMLLSAGRGSRH